MQVLGFLGYFLGYLLWALFYVFQNFGIAIIVFTVVIKLVLFPFSIKQQKSMAGTARLSKKQKELQEKYGNNRQLLQEEMNKLYEKEGVKPMGGCLTMIVPMLVLFGVFYAVAYPLTNTLHIDANHVNDAVAYINKIPGYASATNPAMVVIRAPPINSPMDIGMEMPVEVRYGGRDSIGIRLIQNIPIAPGTPENRT